MTTTLNETLPLEFSPEKQLEILQQVISSIALGSDGPGEIFASTSEDDVVYLDDEGDKILGMLEGYDDYDVVITDVDYQRSGVPELGINAAGGFPEAVFGYDPDANGLYLSGNIQKNIVVGSIGDDTVNGFFDDDILYGGAGNDSIIGGVGADTLIGSTGDDTLIGNFGADVFEGGLGSDTYLYFNASEGDQIVTERWWQDGVDTIVTNFDINLGENGAWIENAVSDNNAAIEFSGNFLDNELITQGGNDTLVGRGGDDTIISSAGDNYMSGGMGNDDITGGTGNDTVLGGLGDDSLKGKDGDDELIGGFGDDTLKGSAGNDIYDGGAGADTYIGASGDDIYYLNEGDVLRGERWWKDGDDTVVASVDFATNDWDGGHFETVQLAAGSAAENATANFQDNTIIGNQNDNTLNGVRGDDTISGGAGNDTINAGGNDDYLFGGSGNDSLDGGRDADYLFGGSGSDTLTGGAGDDVFYAQAFGDDEPVVNEQDVITDFDRSSDSIDIGFGAPTTEAETADAANSGPEAVDLELSLEGADLIVDLGAGRSLRIVDIVDENDENADEAEDFVVLF